MNAFEQPRKKNPEPENPDLNKPLKDIDLVARKQEAINAALEKQLSQTASVPPRNKQNLEESINGFMEKIKDQINENPEI